MKHWLIWDSQPYNDLRRGYFNEYWRCVSTSRFPVCGSSDGYLSVALRKSAYRPLLPESQAAKVLIVRTLGEL